MGGKNDRQLAQIIAADVAKAGGRAYYVGGAVRDECMGVECKDIDVEVYGISPQQLRKVLSARTDFSAERFTLSASTCICGRGASSSFLAEERTSG